MQKIHLPNITKKSILACGADMKGAFALTKENYIHIYDGYGDLSNSDNFNKYKKDINSVIRNTKPKIIACDMHPDYFSVGLANESITSNLKPKLIQHHKAHLASAIIENGIKGKVIGVAFDGTGYGEDGNIWGGEFFTGQLKNLNRIAHLEYICMPGGESSIRNPWQMALSYLYRAFGKEVKTLKLPFFKNIKKEEMNIILKMIDSDFNCPKTSSIGRLFDSVSSILGLIYKDAREAEGPIKLENLAIYDTEDFYDFKIKKGSPHIIKTDNIIRGIVGDIKSKREFSYISMKFHNTISMIILKICRLYPDVKKVVLSGGVFLNKVLLYKTKELLGKEGFQVFTQNKSTVTDSGIPIGQIALS